MKHEMTIVEFIQAIEKLPYYEYREGWIRCIAYSHEPDLAMVFGEPDVKIDTSHGKVTICLIGLDVYDPTTGEIRFTSNAFWRV